MMYRPEGWNNPYKDCIGDDGSRMTGCDDIYEAGADAMLEALRKGGAYYGEIDFWRGQHHYWTGTGKAGHWAFIPEEKINITEKEE